MVFQQIRKRTGHHLGGLDSRTAFFPADSWMPVDHKLCSGLDPVGENLLSSLKSPPNRRWVKPPERWPRPTREAEETEETLAPLSELELELDGCSGDAGMTLPRRETPLSTRGMRDTSSRILKHFILSLCRTLLELDYCCSKS